MNEMCAHCPEGSVTTDDFKGCIKYTCSIENCEDCYYYDGKEFNMRFSRQN